MYRRLLLAGVGVAALAWLGLGGSAPADDKDKAHHAHGPYATCARACAECSLQCESCFAHCSHLVAEGKKDHVRSMRTCNDCGDFCALAARITGRHGPTAVTTCEACAKVCDMCGAACEKFPDDEHMKACAKSCRDCAKACREMIKNAGHEDGTEESGK
jgi:hypothetical protein